MAVDLGAAMNEGDPSTVTPELKGGDGRRILGTNHDDVLAKEGVRLVVVVGHLGQVLARDAEMVGQVVVAGGHDELAGAERVGPVKAVHGVHAEVSVRSRNRSNAFILAHVQAIVLRHLAVVLERLATGGLLIGRGKGHIPDLEQLRRGEKGHVGRVVEE